jgi:hypothetical protein
MQSVTAGAPRQRGMTLHSGCTPKKTKALQVSTCKALCAQDKIRTCTPFRAPPPQSGLSTNFNTWASKQGRKFIAFPHKNRTNSSIIPLLLTSSLFPSSAFTFITHLFFTLPSSTPPETSSPFPPRSTSQKSAPYGNTL